MPGSAIWGCPGFPMPTYRSAGSRNPNAREARDEDPTGPSAWDMRRSSRGSHRHGAGHRQCRSCIDLIHRHRPEALSNLDPMGKVDELISARTRQLFWALSSSIERSPLEACWESEGFSPSEGSFSGGTRKQVFSSFAAGVDWTDDRQVERALRAFEGMLIECSDSYGWGATLAKITASLTRDGYQVSPTLQILPVGAWRPEVARHDAKAYKDSLRLLRGARNAMERLGLLTARMPEERLRDVLLVALNAYFEGQSTGETLNGRGKTDILIRIGDRNVSICECKFYKGPQSVTEALEQLLGYTDTGARRVSLLIFYREKDPDARIVDTIDTLRAHPRCEPSDASSDDDRQWNFVVRGSGAPGTAPRAEVAFIPFVIA